MGWSEGPEKLPLYILSHEKIECRRIRFSDVSVNSKHVVMAVPPSPLNGILAGYIDGASVVQWLARVTTNPLARV